jgi:fructokinase
MRIGIDLGGTKIEVLALGDDGTELARRRLPTPKGDYAGTVETIARLVEWAEAETGRSGPVGVGIPGTISPATGLIKGANSVVLIGHALDRDLADRLGRPLRLANDANCFALSEASDGAGTGAEVVFGAILGTGCGGGTVVRGSVLTGPNSIAGEWGHNPLPWPQGAEHPGHACYCGKSGCIETFVSGTGFAAWHKADYGEDLDPSEIVARAMRDEPKARASLDRYEERLARSLATVINLMDPDVIVLGGGMSNADELYERVPQIWQKWVFSDTVVTPLRKAAHGDSSGVRGAAWLWPKPGR